MLTAINALLSLVPRWVWIALVAALSATSCKLKWDNTGLSLEVEKHATRIAELQLGIEASHAAAVQQAALFTQQARTAEQARTAREKVILADAADARSELERMRVSSKKGMYSLHISASAIAPGLDTALADDPLLRISEEYVALAERCDRHVSDIKTLIEAWPTVKPIEKVAE